MKKIFSDSKRISGSIVGSFDQSFAVYSEGSHYVVFVEGRSIRKGSINGSGRYDAQGVRDAAVRYGFKLPAGLV